MRIISNEELLVVSGGDGDELFDTMGNFSGWANDSESEEKEPGESGVSVQTVEITAERLTDFAKIAFDAKMLCEAFNAAGLVGGNVTASTHGISISATAGAKGGLKDVAEVNGSGTYTKNTAGPTISAPCN